MSKDIYALYVLALKDKFNINLTMRTYHYSGCKLECCMVEYWSDDKKTSGSWWISNG